MGTAGRWRIGPLELWIQRLEGEWRIASEQGDDPLDDALEREVPCVIDGVLDRESTERYASNSKTEVIRLAAALADRSVVTRSDKPLHVPPGEEISVFVSSPLWVRIEAGEPGKLLRELPVFRPSDTWFGPNTREGELCYASRTHHRLRLEQIPARPHRAVTSVLVRNRASGMLSLDRMQVPVMHLSLYRSQEGHLWTDDVVFERRGEDDFAELRTRSRSDARWTIKVTRIAPPRIHARDNAMVRAFTSLFR